MVTVPPGQSVADELCIEYTAVGKMDNSDDPIVLIGTIEFDRHRLAFRRGPGELLCFWSERLAQLRTVNPFQADTVVPGIRAYDERITVGHVNDRALQGTLLRLRRWRPLGGDFEPANRPRGRKDNQNGDDRGGDTHSPAALPKARHPLGGPRDFQLLNKTSDALPGKSPSGSGPCLR